MRLPRHLIAFVTVAALAQPGHCAPADEWLYEATPYLYAAGLDGTIGVRGVTERVDLSFGDIVSKLDFAFQGTFLARKGPVSLALDVEYMDLSDNSARSVNGPAGRAAVLGKLDATSKITILQGIAGYRIVDELTKVDVVAALRATLLDVDLDLKGTLTVGDAVFGRSRSLSGSEDWVDGVVGVRVLHPVSNEVSLFGYADVGGGGSDLTWQAVAGVDWAYDKRFTARFGYRVLSWDYSRHGVVWDVRLHGPYAGLGIRF